MNLLGKRVGTGEDPQDLLTVIDRIGETVTAKYVVTHETPDPTRDGRRRSFIVQVDRPTGRGQATGSYTAPLDRPAGTLTGVARSEDGTLLADVAVQVLNSGNALIGAALSGSDGKFTVSNLSPGDYTVQGTKSGFAPASAPAHINADTETNVTLTLKRLEDLPLTQKQDLISLLGGWYPVAESQAQGLLAQTKTKQDNETLTQSGRYPLK